MRDGRWGREGVSGIAIVVRWNACYGCDEG